MFLYGREVVFKTPHHEQSLIIWCSFRDLYMHKLSTISPKRHLLALMKYNSVSKTPFQNFRAVNNAVTKKTV